MLSRLTNIFVGVLVFAGFTIINYLAGPTSTALISSSTNQFFQSTQYLWYGVIISVFVVQQGWRDMPRPVSTAEVQELQPIIEQYLYAALGDYYNFLIGEERPLVPARMNLMLKVRKQPFESARLKIVYEICCNPNKSPFPTGDSQAIENLPWTKACYSIVEKSTLWQKGQGACGQAYETGQITFFDSMDPVLKGPTERLTDQQKQAVGGVNSVISIPIWLHKKVIGVLNVDSPATIDQTCFDDMTVIKLLDGYSDSIALVSAIFVDGLKSP